MENVIRRGISNAQWEFNIFLVHHAYIAAAFDKNKTFNQQAVCLIIQTARSLDYDVSSQPLSKSTVHGVFKKIRKEHTATMTAAYEPNCPLVVRAGFPI